MVAQARADRHICTKLVHRNRSSVMKSRQTAAFLALFLGAFGVHRYYLGQAGLGIFYFFSNFLMPFFRLPFGFILGIIDAFAFFFMSDEEFDRRYNKKGKIREKRRTTRQRVERRRRPEKDRVTAQRARKVKATRRNPFKLSGKKKLAEFDLNGAIEDLKRSIEITQDDADVHYMLASAYSLNEDAENAFSHLSQAVGYGFKDYEKIKTDDALAFIRIHPDFESFERAGYRIGGPVQRPPQEDVKDDTLLAQLQRLAEMRKKGLITDEDFEIEKRRIMR